MLPFLTIDQETLTFHQALTYLRHAGGFQRFLKDILRQYLLEKEIKLQESIEVSPAQVDRAISSFLLQAQLIDPNQFHQWLTANSLTYDEFRNQVEFGVKLEKFKLKIIQPKVEQYFQDNQALFKQVVFSQIFFLEPAEAENIKQQILESNESFDSVLQNSSTRIKSISERTPPLLIRNLPDPLKKDMETAGLGEILGPIFINKSYGIFRVEEIQPATLTESLKQDLINQFFEEWMQTKINQMQVKIAGVAGEVSSKSTGEIKEPINS